MTYKLVQISGDNVVLLKKYGDTPNKAISSLLVAPVSKETGDMTAIEACIQRVVSKEIEKLKEGIRNTNAEFMRYLSSGQGAIQLPEIKGDTFIGKNPANEFRRANHMSLREEK